MSASPASAPKIVFCPPVVIEEPVRVIENKESIVRKEKVKALNELSNKLNIIAVIADEVYEKNKKKKKDKKRERKIYI